MLRSASIESMSFSCIAEGLWQVVGCCIDCKLCRCRGQVESQAELERGREKSIRHVSISLSREEKRERSKGGGKFRVGGAEVGAGADIGDRVGSSMRSLEDWDRSLGQKG